MKKTVTVLTVPAVMILLALLIIPAYAIPGGNAGFPGGKMGGGNITTHLNRLEEQGYDVSAIRTAVENGDMDTARSLMQQFMEEHKGELPAPPGKEDRMTTHLDRLEEQGFDVTAIRTAVENGDMDTSRSLMQQFME
ncbi:MAG: hypothetical protein LUQ33_04915, partial [Methanoregulaceae archaeon]|nr:hypothetical protein [Methanoregulaceae archaeon]